MKRFAFGLTALIFLNGCGRELGPKEAPIEHQALQKKLSPYTDAGDATATNALEIIQNESALEDVEAVGNFFLKIHTTQSERLRERLTTLSRGVLQKNGELLGGEQQTQIANQVIEDYMTSNGAGFLDSGETEELVRLYLNDPEQAELAFEEALDEEGFIRETQALAIILATKIHKDLNLVAENSSKVDFKAATDLLVKARDAYKKNPNFSDMQKEFNLASQAQVRVTSHGSQLSFRIAQVKEFLKSMVDGIEEREVPKGRRAQRLGEARRLREFTAHRFDLSRDIYNRFLADWRGYQQSYDDVKAHVAQVELLSELGKLAPIAVIQPARRERLDK